MAGADLVRQLFAEWPGLSPEEIERFFTSDAVYRNICGDRVLSGPRAIAGAMEVYRARFEQIESRLVRLAEDGDVVMCERLDKLWLPNGRQIEFGGMACIESRGDQISAWRDYFDLATLRRRVDLTES